MKKLVLCLIIVTFFAGMVAAQDISRVSNNYIRPTFAIGFASASMDGESEAGFTPSFDIDFVHNSGLTVGFQYVIFGHSDFAMGFSSTGIGYTFDAGKWCAGGKFMFVPLELFFGGTWGIGFDINGTFWVNKNLGITAIIDLYFPKDVVIFSLRAGLSLKF